MNLLERLGIELPVIQAPMAGSQGSALAIAVSNAGGLGSLPCAMLSIDGMRKELTAVRAATRRPFAVNYFCHAPPRDDASREAAWRAKLTPYYRELGIDPNNTPKGPPRRPFDDEYADALSRVGAARRQLPLRVAVAGVARQGPLLGRLRVVVGNYGRRSALARGPWRRRGDRTRRRSRRPSRHVPDDRRHDAGGYVRIAAADRARGPGAGDCRRAGSPMHAASPRCWRSAPRRRRSAPRISCVPRRQRPRHTAPHSRATRRA